MGLVGQNVHCRRQCVEARSADLSSARSAKKFFRVIFQLPGWALVAPSCFALHCHCSLVSVQSVTVSLSKWKGNVRCAGSPRLLATSFLLVLFHFLAPPLSKSHVVLRIASLFFAKLTIVLNKRPDNVSSRHFKFCCNATGLVNRLSLEPGPQYVARFLCIHRGGRSVPPDVGKYTMVCQNIGPAVAGSAGPVPPPLPDVQRDKHRYDCV